MEPQITAEDMINEMTSQCASMMQELVGARIVIRKLQERVDELEVALPKEGETTTEPDIHQGSV